MIRYIAAFVAATVSIVASIAPVHAAPAQVQTQIQHFQIPPGDLGQALDAYIRQSGRQLIYRVDDVRGVHSPGVQGEMSADEALAALLSGSGFSSRSDSSGALAVVRTDAPLSEVVVTATAGGQGIERQKASFSTTSLNSEDIHRLAPLNTAALLQGIPGVTVHSTGGEQGNNIFVRGFPSSGDAPYVTFQLAGSAVFDPPTVAWFGNADVIRIDEMVDHVEAVRGGPAQVLSNGQVGLTVNILPKTGTDVVHGVGEISTTDYGKRRFDGQVSGPLDENTFFSVGGFYQNGDNVRRLHFASELGGQLSANILHKFDRGSVLVWGRILQENDTWNLPIPIIVDNGNVREYPGFDIHTGAIGSPQERELTLRSGDAFRFDQGRGSRIGNGGFNVSYEMSDAISVQEKASYLGGSVNTNALFPNAPVSAAAEASAQGGAFGSLTNVATGEVLPSTTPVMQVGAWIADKQVKNINNDLSVTWHSGVNKLTAGYYFAAFSSRDYWNLGNNLLLQAKTNGPILSLTLADGTKVTGADNFINGSTTLRGEDYQGTDDAGFVSDEWQATSKLRLDAGARLQYHHIEGSFRNTATAADGTAIFLNTYTDQRANSHKVAASAGADYELTSQLGLWARYSRGNIFPQFDTVQSGLVGTQTVDAMEGGVNYTTSVLRLYGNAFYNKFRGIENFDLAANGATFIRHGGANTYGTEIYATVGSFKGFSIGGSATYLHARFTDYVVNGIDSSGNQVQAQPQWQGRMNVSYRYDAGFGAFTLYGAGTFVGKRFGNETNTQILPAYTKVDAGALLEMSGGEFFRVSVDNLNNSAGLTEGDVRADLTRSNAGVSLGRPLQGRSFQFTGGYRF
ncbi:MAG: TonB-dependent receptor [Gammaproteobacteria bacterium]|nr:TonB-dependent receptor [Gammaproteobacteria bacterium]